MYPFYETRRLMVEVGKSFINTPYYWGGDDPMTGFDCSGMVVEIMKSVGLMGERQDMNANSMWHSFIPPDDVDKIWMPGNMVFYGKDDHASHVGMLIEDFFILNAAGGGSGVKSREAAAAVNAFIKVRPVHYRGDFLGVRLPLFKNLAVYDINCEYAMFKQYSV